MGITEIEAVEPPPSPEAGTAAPAEARLCSRGCHVLPPDAKFDPHTGASLDAPVTATAEATEATDATVRGPLALAVRLVTPLAAAVVGVAVIGLLAITVGPRFLPYQALVVRSGSMEPAIQTGSVVFYHHVPAEKVKVGEVVVFSEPGQANKQVTHRVFQIKSGQTGRYFITKGDANGAADAWRVPALGTGWVASFHVPLVGYILTDLQSPLARLLLLLIPAFALGAITLYEIWRDRSPRLAA
jgi:signal peptidase